MLPVRQYIDYFAKLWHESPTYFPHFPNTYSSDEKAIREQNYEHFEEKIKEFQNRRKIQEVQKDPGSSFFPMFRAFLETVFDFEQDHLRLILSDEFKDVSKDFFYKARGFGPELMPENIYQGMRKADQ